METISVLEHTTEFRENSNKEIQLNFDKEKKKKKKKKKGVHQMC